MKSTNANKKSHKFSLNLDILGLSLKEKKVLNCLLYSEVANNSSKALNIKINTPLLINKQTKISRTAIYHILNVLKKRGLIERYKENGKFYYRMVSDEEIANKLYEIKKELIGLAEGRSEMRGILTLGKVPKAEGVNLSGVILHQGLDAVKSCFVKMFSGNKNCKFIGVQGNNTLPLYGKHLGEGFVNDLNKKIKENKIIVEGIMAEGWEKKSKESFDNEWAANYTGRMANVHQIPSQYFKHHGEIFIFKDTLYLISLRELTILEIRHGDISLSISMLIKYIMDNTDTVDINKNIKQLYVA